MTSPFVKGQCQHIIKAMAVKVPSNSLHPAEILSGVSLNFPLSVSGISIKSDVTKFFSCYGTTDENVCFVRALNEINIPSVYYFILLDINSLLMTIK